MAGEGAGGRRDGRGPGGERGTAELTYALTIAMSLVLFAVLANAVVAMYGRGVVRGALDEAVRLGSRAPNGAAECQRRAEDATRQLLGAAMRDGVTVTCAESAGRITATATVTWPGWLPLAPDFTFDLGATAVKEHAP